MIHIRFALIGLTILATVQVQARAQSNEWSWQSGNITAATPGDYGGPQTPSQGVPGARQLSATWTDSTGNLWLFGGIGLDSGFRDGSLGDLWKFSPSTSSWTWVGGPQTGNQGGVYGQQGVAATANIPGARLAPSSWIGNNGNLWLFGGSGFDSATSQGCLNDLWSFNPGSAQWTWVSGAETINQPGVYGTLGVSAAANTPGSRNSALTWKDNKGNLWLFGGYSCSPFAAQGGLNDLWMFNPSTSQWTWMSGTNLPNQVSTPGTMGQAGQNNQPGGRSSSVGWADGSGNLWLFGGFGVDETDGAAGGTTLNDLWKYSIGTNEWTWVGGVSTTPSFVSGQPGVYGTQQVPAASNVPGSRWGAVSWSDKSGNLWLFGGLGFDSVNDEGSLNDLWEYSPQTNVWEWMGGSVFDSTDCTTTAQWCGAPSVYGTLSKADLGNTPGGRFGASGWTDAQGNFWLFGGDGYDGEANFGDLNDMWEFQPNTNGQQVTATPDFSPLPGTYSTWQTVGITDATAGATIQYTINGATPATAYSGPITVVSSETIQAIAAATGYANSNVATASYTAQLPQTATPTIDVAAGSYPAPQTVTISDATPGALIYYAIGAAPVVPDILYTAPITVSTAETLQVMALANGFAWSNEATAAYIIGTNPSAQWTWMGGSSTSLTGIEPGWYGTLQTSAASNIPGGRKFAASWTDQSGNLWLFGGLGDDSTPTNGNYLNDLWEFNPLTAQWTWMSGSNTVSVCSKGSCGMPGLYGKLSTPAQTNTPGGRSGGIGWTDAQGYLWLFGGYGFDSSGSLGYLNDLWRFDISSKQWTWMGGASQFPLFLGTPGIYGTLGTHSASNAPGGRSSEAEWIDRTGNLWLYGGTGMDESGVVCNLNDLWVWYPGVQEWSWMGGYRGACPDFNGGYPGNYGALGVPAVGNLPWSLDCGSSWTDANGNLWLFGGIGNDPTPAGYYLNDMLEFYPTLNEWAFTSADSVGAGGTGSGAYGVMGVWSPANYPGERCFAQSWTDSAGNFWLFGGSGLGSGVEAGLLNDLWEFKPAVNEWVWLGGSGSFPGPNLGQPGQYGTLGSASPGNIPGGRTGAATWTDKSGNFWLFGGFGENGQATIQDLNDLWQFGLSDPPAVKPPLPAAAPIFSPVSGTYTAAQTVTISDNTPGATIYFTTDGSDPVSTSPIYSGPIAISGSSTFVNAIAVANGHSISDVVASAYFITAPYTATPTFSVPGGTYTSSQSVSMMDSTAMAKIYYTTDGSTPTSSSTQYAGPITVLTSETIQAIGTASGYSNSPIASARYIISLPPNFALSATPSSLNISSGSSGTVILTVTPQYGFNSSVTFGCSGLPGGISCAFQPPSVTPANTSVTTTITISAQGSAAAIHAGFSSPFTLSTVAVVICLFGRRRHRTVRLTLLVGLAGTVLMLASACGSGGSASTSGPSTSAITVTATSGSLQQSTVLTVTVN